MDLEREILKDLESEWTKESNYHMYVWFQMFHLEREEGWTKVEISKLRDQQHAVDITMWLHDNGFKETVNYYRDGREFLFERAEDATMFTLRWA